MCVQARCGTWCGGRTGPRCAASSLMPWRVRLIWELWTFRASWYGHTLRLANVHCASNLWSEVKGGIGQSGSWRAAFRPFYRTPACFSPAGKIEGCPPFVHKGRVVTPAEVHDVMHDQVRWGGWL